MDEASKTQATSLENEPELLQAELPPTQAEQVPANQQTRKRQLDSDDNADPQTKQARTTRPISEPAQLTRKNLAEFNRMGKKKTTYPTDGSLTTTKTTSTTTSGFAIQARNNGILDPIDSKPPTNLEDIHKRHASSRATASPAESVYGHYANKVGKAPNEATIVVEASGQLLKDYVDKGYDRVFNQAFTGLPKNMGFNDGLSAPQPDFVEGPEMGEFRPFPIANHVPGASLYKDNPHSVTLPHIAGEWKGPDGSLRIAELQSAYDGAALVHARNQALAYMGQSDPPGHAVITTFTTDGTTLNHYAHYAAPSAEDPDALEYHQYHVSSTNLTRTYQGHKDGRKSLRNAQDHAKTQSEQLRDQLKQHWKQNRNQLPPVAEGVHPPDVEPPPQATDGYEDASPHVLQEEEEDEEDYEIVQPATHKGSLHHSKSSHRHDATQHSLKSHQHLLPNHSSSESSRHLSSHGSDHKQKAPSSQTSSHGSSGHTSKHGSYWKKNSKGYYYHKHSDNTVTWYNDYHNPEIP